MENRFDDKRFHGWKPDWSKHELVIKKYTSEEDDEITEYILKKPDTCMEMVVFCNHSGNLSVTGDYGNWIFDRAFYPKKDLKVSDSYWCEKLIRNSCQSFEFDLEANLYAYAEEEKQMREENPEIFDKNSPDYDEDLVEFYEEIQKCDDEIEYWNCIADHLIDEPNDYKMISEQLLIIFDAFEEICRRID